MHETHWIEWTGTRLQSRDRKALLAGLTPEQNAHLREHDYVFVEGSGVLWRPPGGEPCRRARFTHGTHFRTQRGEFYVDSEGGVRELPRTDQVEEEEHPFIREDDVRAALG